MSTINYTIPSYEKIIKKDFGSKHAAKVINRLEYWFSKMPAGFFKFLEPCKHYLYREGDSWTEELDFSRQVFNSVFDLIGVRYKSKTEFMSAHDKFNGKLYASYYDRQNNQMFFIRNNQLITSYFSQLIESVKKSYTQKKQKNQKNIIPRSTKFSDPLIKNTNLQTNSLSLEKKEKISEKNNFLSSEDRSNASEMIKIWKETIGETKLKFISSTVLERLSACLKTHFENNLENWKHYLHLLSSSRFLMGEVENTKFRQIYLLYAITTECIEKIRGGEYTVKDRSTNLDREISDRAAKQVEIYKEIKKIEESEKDFANKQERLRDQALEEKFDQLPPEEKEAICNEFVTDFHLKYPGLSVGKYMTSKWKNNPCADPMFLLFLSENNPELDSSVELDNSFQNRINELRNEYTKLNDEIGHFLERKEDAVMGQNTFMKFFGLAGEK
ncbi:MAG: hypothetical protein KA477_00060 [Candidatus Levybacteria bacterium]|jgi:hypothetical protein|nr:hypothetical protein [Candidatus Levybacteria bacterium]